MTRNEKIYNDIAATVDTYTKEILEERSEVLRRLEEIEEVEKQVFFTVQQMNSFEVLISQRFLLMEENVPTVLSTEYHSDG